MPALPDTTTRFPLVPRPRPACVPLHQRVEHLVTLAQTASDTMDASVASTVYNQAALLASDLGQPDHARELCEQHATMYLSAAPLPAGSAIRALEPVVNLARLQIRAGAPEDALDRLRRLLHAVSDGIETEFDAVRVPADLTHTAADRTEVRDWLWRVLLADGSRALATAGRWEEALTHLREWKGVGQRMLDGRQVAVVAALAGDRTDQAARLIAETAPGEPWEQAVTACLAALCHRAGTDPDELTDAVLAVLVAPGPVVFQTRLGLTALNLAPLASTATAQRITDQIHCRILDADDGFAAREALVDPLFHKLVSPTQLTNLRVLIARSGLRTGALPSPLHRSLNAALDLSEDVIRESVLTP
ncbi:hypothetical protein ABT117_16975 [Streptomyces sp. NPDC002262]|uniref:hypothetical protein n=1 Tax=Streptomyces sp. NPDC002262 TaxID=3154414 RepID=UPI003324154F